ncbi:hypothetical protein ACFS3C_17715 [Azotobacter vinelandii]
MVGAGIVAGGPYLCAKSWAGNSLLVNATTTCMHPLTAGSGPNTPLLARYAATLAEYGQIAPLKNLEDDRIYIFSGTRDEIVTTTVVNQTREFFKAVGVPEASIRYDRSIAAGHAFLTDDDTDTACALTRSPYINDCDFSQAGAILEQIYPGLKSPARHRDDSLIAFDQEEFIDSPYTSMDDTAYAYVPTACRSGKSCPVHVVFHGCRQGSHFIGDQYYARTGYNRLAEANDLIMLYPPGAAIQRLAAESRRLLGLLGLFFAGQSDPGLLHPQRSSTARHPQDDRPPCRAPILSQPTAHRKKDHGCRHRERHDRSEAVRGTQTLERLRQRKRPQRTAHLRGHDTGQRQPADRPAGHGVHAVRRLEPHRHALGEALGPVLRLPGADRDPVGRPGKGKRLLHPFPDDHPGQRQAGRRSHAGGASTPQQILASYLEAGLSIARQYQADASEHASALGQIRSAYNVWLQRTLENLGHETVEEPTPAAASQPAASPPPASAAEPAAGKDSGA